MPLRQRPAAGTSFGVPEGLLASATIRTSTIADRAQRAETTVQDPLSFDLENVSELPRGEWSGESEPGVDA
jgi:hypothetical protein